MKPKTMIAVLATASIALMTPSTAAAWIASHPGGSDDPTEGIESFGAGWSPESIAGTDTWMSSVDSPKAIVVMVHGIRQPRTDLRELAVHLRDKGYAIALPKLGYVDGSEPYSGGGREAGSVRAVVESIRSSYEVPVVLMGFSAGGFASALAVSQGLEVDALVLDSAFPSAETTFVDVAGERAHLPRFMFLGMEPIFRLFSRGGRLAGVGAVESTPPPTFVIHCVNDDYVEPDNAEKLSARFAGETWLAPGDGHGGAWYFDPGEYERRVDRFISTAIA